MTFGLLNLFDPNRAKQLKLLRGKHRLAGLIGDLGVLAILIGGTKGFKGTDGAGGGKYSTFGEMSEADGIRYRDCNYEKIRELSIKNPNANSMTLGKYLKNPDGSVSLEAYTEMAKGTGDTYFDLGVKWGEIEKSYGLTDKDMFELFNQRALDNAVGKGKTIRFSQNPTLREYEGSDLADEWSYLKNKYNYIDLIKEGDYWYGVK